MRSTAWLTLLLIPLSLNAQRKPFSADALLKIQRLADPQLSPDGSLVAFTAGLPDLQANRVVHAVWTVPLVGGEARKLADDAERPRWSPDGKKIYYASGGQIRAMNADGSESVQITHFSTRAGDHIVSPDGKFLLFTSEVYPECGADDACNARRTSEDRASKVQARVIDNLLFRHWTDWQGKTRRHLFSISLGDGAPGAGKITDLSPGNRIVPPFSLGGPDDYAISPDSREVCFSMNGDAVPAVSTNNDLFVVPIAGGTLVKITSGLGSDSSPLYSPDGRYLAWRSQQRGGYESDKWRLMVLDRATGKSSLPAESLDRSVDSFVWSPDSKRLFFTAVDRGHAAIQFVPVEGGGTRFVVRGANTLGDMQFTPDGKTIVFTRESGSAPAEICKATSGGSAVALTHLNDGLLSEYELSPLDDFTVNGAENTPVQSFVVKPPNFNAAAKYPVLMLIHGGPQGEWGESWTYRWNAQVFAGAGYVVVMPNPRGSIGYGQKFTDDINQDWGGKPYADLMAVTDYVAKLPYVDADRMAAAGGSYGGYMVNWILGHTNRFRCLISHAGVYDLRSEAESTEELWFPIWEFGGMPWENPEVYDRWSPSKFAQEFRTPTLVIHGELDFRIPYSQGLQLFTTLQLRKVPSQLLIFPDEGHWVLKPQNSALWYKTFLAWVDNWTKK